VVFDLGGFKGEWAIEILARYNPKELYIFEPVKKFADDIQKRFIKNSRVKVFAFGLGNKDFTEEIAVENASTSVYKKDQGSKEKIEIKDIKKFLEEKNIDKIDLMKINIEGGEYDLLEYLIENTLIQKIKNIQIQFHDFVPGAHNKMERIRNGLSKTHSPTYKYDFIWENWRLK
jgi:FkbM family methyltransferase